MGYNIVMASGLGLTTTGLLTYLYLKLREYKFGYGEGYKTYKYVSKIKRWFSNRKKIVLEKKDKLIILGITTALIGTANSIRSVPKLIIWGIIVGFLVVLIYQKVHLAGEKSRKVNEAAILFEAIELYMKAGYSQYQAIRSSRILVNKIRPAVDKCLNYWGIGPRKALEILQKEINLPEVDTLILILSNIESSGAESMQDVIGKEVFNMENLRKVKMQIKISNRPLIFIIYRVLPLISIIGITVGSLLYRTYAVLEQTGFIQF